MENLLNKYIDTVIAYGEATEMGNSRVANKKIKEADKLEEQMKDISKVEFDMHMLELLNHEDGYVIYFAAYSLLSNYTENAKEALEKLSIRKKCMLGFLAKRAIIDWEEDTL